MLDGDEPGAAAQERLLERSLAEMLSCCRQLLAERRVTQSEARYLWDWFDRHADVVENWPGVMLARRLGSIFMDGRVAEEERVDLNLLFQDLASGRATVLIGKGVDLGLPIDSPPSPVEFAGRTYVFSGSFAFGPIRTCEDAVYQLSGRIASTINEKTDYLVIGTFGSEALLPSIRHKIQQVLELRRLGASTRIIGEDHWVGAMPYSETNPPVTERT